MGGAGSVVSYLAPTTATSDPAERFGVLNNTTAGGVFSVTGSAAGGTILRFNSLNVTAGLTFRGDDLGGITLGAGVTRILIDAFTSNLPVIPNVFFANTAGTGTSTSPAGYDSCAVWFSLPPRPLPAPRSTTSRRITSRPPPPTRPTPMRPPRRACRFTASHSMAVRR